MVALRFVSGMFEAVADPCFVAITSMWFTRIQQPTVIGLWYMANGIGIACGGIIGYGIGHIKGDLPSWSYEFLIVGWVISPSFISSQESMLIHIVASLALCGLSSWEL